jgi:hypothetical protein
MTKGARMPLFFMRTAEKGTPKVKPMPADTPMNSPMLAASCGCSLTSHTYAWPRPNMHEVHPSMAAAAYIGANEDEQATIPAPTPMPAAERARKGLRPYLSLKVAHIFVVSSVNIASVARSEPSFICPALVTVLSPEIMVLTRLGIAGIAMATLKK